MGETVQVAPEPVEGLAGRVDAVGLALSELACRAQAAGAELGCVPAAARLSNVAGWCDQMADDLRLLVERALALDEEVASVVSAAGLGGPWEQPQPEPRRNHLGEVAGGAWDSFASTVLSLDALTLQMLRDPVGWWRDWGDVAEGVIFAVGNPGEAARAAVDLDTLQANPARWTGQLIPDLLGAAVTGGATIGVRRSANAAETLTDLGRGATVLPDVGAVGSRLPDREVARRVLLKTKLWWHASTGSRLDDYISTLPRGRSKAENIRVVPDLVHMETLIAEVRRQTTPTPDPLYPGEEWFVYPDGLRVGTRTSDRHGLTIDVRTPDDRQWKVHIDGS